MMTIRIWKMPRTQTLYSEPTVLVALVLAQLEVMCGMKERKLERVEPTEDERRFCLFVVRLDSLVGRRLSRVVL
jgi:hypothetical protein